MSITQELEDMLREYKDNKNYIADAEERIEIWRDIIKNGNTKDFEFGINSNSKFELGIRTTKYCRFSVVENFIIGKKLTPEELKKWIADEESRINYKKDEIIAINTALDMLPIYTIKYKSELYEFKLQKYIIECRYFENMHFKQIQDRLLSIYKLEMSKRYIEELNHNSIKELENNLSKYIELRKHKRVVF